MLRINSAVGFLKIWSFCPFSRLNSPKKEGRSKTVNGSRFTVYGLRFTVYGLRFTVYGLRLTVHGLRLTVNGSRFTFYGLRFTVYGLRKIHHRPDRRIGTPLQAYAGLDAPAEDTQSEPLPVLWTVRKAATKEQGGHFYSLSIGISRNFAPAGDKKVQGNWASHCQAGEIKILCVPLGIIR